MLSSFDNANIGFQYDKQTNVREQFINLGARPFGTANENAIYYAKYKKRNYSLSMWQTT